MKTSFRLLALTALAALIASCASAPPPAGVDGSVVPDSYVGTGSDLAQVTAIHKAKLDIVRKALTSLMGPRAMELYETQLRVAIWNTNTPDQYIIPSSIENLGRTRNGDQWVFELRAKIDWDSLTSTLMAFDIPYGTRASTATGVATGGTGGTVAAGGTGGSAQPALNANQQRARDLVRGEMGGTTPAPGGTSTTPATTTTAPGGTTTTAPASITATPADWGQATAQEQSIIRRYVETMTYMVYFPDGATEAPELMRAAVTQANRFLAQNTMEAIDMAQIERIKADQRAVYEEEAGRDLSFTQWIAQKLNADVYVEIESTTSAETLGTSRHAAQANLTMKLYDPSTARLLGSVPYNSGRQFSNTSQLDARTVAIQASVWAAMPVAIQQAKNYMTTALTRGIRYTLTIQNTSDSRLMSRFRSAMAQRVKQINVLSSSPQETTYEVYFIGLLADLEDLVYRVTDTVPGLEGMYQVMARGKALTMNSGL